jgi:acyl carrier protein
VLRPATGLTPTLTGVSDPLISLFAEGLGVDATSLTEDTSPDNATEWDSLAAITLVSLIEEQFDVRLSAREIMKMQTIGLARSVLQGKGVTGI